MQKDELELTVWLKRANAMLKKGYGIDFDNDAGLTDEQLRSYAATFADPERFVEWFAEKYDLNALSDWGWPLA